MNIWTFETLICESSCVKFILVHFLVLVQPYGKCQPYWSQSESSVLLRWFVSTPWYLLYPYCPRPQLSLVAPMLDNVSVHDRHGMTFFLFPHLSSQCPVVFDGVIAEDGGKGTFNTSSITFISSWNSEQNTSYHMISIHCTETEICTHQSWIPCCLESLHLISALNWEERQPWSNSRWWCGGSL